jgi:hypothetical protein
MRKRRKALAHLSGTSRRVDTLTTARLTRVNRTRQEGTMRFFRFPALTNEMVAEPLYCPRGLACAAVFLCRMMPNAESPDFSIRAFHTAGCIELLHYVQLYGFNFRKRDWFPLQTIFLRNSSKVWCRSGYGLACKAMKRRSTRLHTSNLPPRPRSSADQSAGFLNRMSAVRIGPRAPNMERWVNGQTNQFPPTRTKRSQFSPSDSSMKLPTHLKPSFANIRSDAELRAAASASTCSSARISNP